MGKIKVFMYVGSSILCLLIISQLIQGYDGKLHIIVCDVGQGDAILIRTPQRNDILVDGGPDRSVLKCLDDHLPFWDRTISMVLLSHPHYDHFRGLIDVLSRYKVQIVGQEDLINTSEAYGIFANLVHSESAVVKVMERGVTLSFADGVTIKVLGPESEFLSQENPDGTTGSDNPPALILHVTYGNFDVLLPGDSDGEDLVKFLPANFRPDVLVLPHHGSEHGYTQAAANVLTPGQALVSVGEDNSYGHPHALVVELLEKKKIPLYRTDQMGSIEITVDREGRISIHTEK